VAHTIDALKAESHRHLAWAMQRAESDLMIRGVCWVMMQDHPDIPVLTIHDAIMVAESALPIACSAIEQVWARAGAIPKVKIVPPA
jgi:hypothetical protein